MGGRGARPENRTFSRDRKLAAAAGASRLAPARGPGDIRLLLVDGWLLSAVSEIS